MRFFVWLEKKVESESSAKVSREWGKWVTIENCTRAHRSAANMSSRAHKERWTLKDSTCCCNFLNWFVFFLLLLYCRTVMKKSAPSSSSFCCCFVLELRESISDISSPLFFLILPRERERNSLVLVTHCTRPSYKLLLLTHTQWSSDDDDDDMLLRKRDAARPPGVLNSREIHIVSAFFSLIFHIAITWWALFTRLHLQIS